MYTFTSLRGIKTVQVLSLRHEKFQTDSGKFAECYFLASSSSKQCRQFTQNVRVCISLNSLSGNSAHFTTQYDETAKQIEYCVPVFVHT